MSRIWSSAFVLTLLFIVSSCERQQHSHSFYYWKFNAAGDSNTALVNQLGVDHFYIHYLDVDWQQGRAVPKAQINHRPDTAFTNKPVTPVVFITNTVFSQISDSACDTLANNIAIKVQAISNQLHVAHYNEVQIDCDWTATTKDKYFLFLQRLKQYLPGKALSATIRLYPYKYPTKMGVPPVDKGVLMCYNIGGINKPETPISIFSYASVAPYIKAESYPLSLAIALPIFGWYVWFRGNSFKGILYEQPSFTEGYLFNKTGSHSFTVQKDTVVQGRYFREGDRIRQEYPDAADIEKVMSLVAHNNPHYQRIIFYYWDEHSVSIYEEAIRKIYNNY